MSDASDKIAEACERHAGAIMRAAGSNLRHYEAYSKKAILAAVIDCYEEAYRAGATFADERAKAKE